jgi:hypothetical protein
MTHHGPDSGGVTTTLPIILYVPLRHTCIRMALFPETPKVESRNYPDFGLPGLWDIIAPRPDLQSGRDVNQTCSPLWELSNAMSHSPNACWKWVDSWLLVVRSQTANLTPAPSFAHNLGYRCPNDQCEAISDIYTSRIFQWHEEHPKARCFAPCCRTLKIRESRRTLNPQLWECEFHLHTWPKWGCDSLQVHQVSLSYMCHRNNQMLLTPKLQNKLPKKVSWFLQLIKTQVPLLVV